MLIDELDIINPLLLKDYTFSEIIISCAKLSRNGLVEINLDGKIVGVELFDSGNLFFKKNDDPYQFFSKTTGSLKFKVNQKLDIDDASKTKIQIPTFLFKGIKEYCPKEKILGRSPISKYQMLLLDREKLNIVEALELKGGEKGLLNLVQDCTKIADIFDSSFLEKDIIDRILYFLYLFEIIKIGNDLSELKLEVDKKRVFTTEEEKERDKVIDYYLNLGEMNYYEILGVNSGDEDVTINSNYKRLKRYYSSVQLVDYFKYSARNILLIINSYLDKSNTVLSDRVKRKEYDIYLKTEVKGDFETESPFMKAEEEIKKVDGYVALQDFKNAVECIKNAIKENPKNSFYYIKYGKTLYMYSKKIKSSDLCDIVSKCYLKALEIDSNCIEAMYELSVLYQEVNDLDKAKKMICRLLSIKPQHLNGVKFVEDNYKEEGFEILINTLYENIDKLSNYEILGLDKKATFIEIKEKYLLLAKKYHPDRFYNSSDLHLKERVTKIFKKIATAYSALKNVKDDKSTSAASSSPDKAATKAVNPKIKKFYELGLDELKRGNKSSAMMNFKLALKIDPNNEEIGELVDKIERGKI